MKKLSFYIMAVIMGAVLIFTGCTEDGGPDFANDSILPESFAVDIPDALSSLSDYKSAAEIDTIKGNDIYEQLRTFIHVGDHAAEIVSEIINAISIYQINRPMSMSFEGDDDGRIKNLVVVADSEYDGVTWDFQLTISDADSEGNEDGGKALQIFWNRNPVKGIALLKPYNIDRMQDVELEDAMYRIDYNSNDVFYDASMTVSIAGLPMVTPLENPYSMRALKLFAGKKGDIIDVYGNSDHPNAILISGDAGFNWAFVASGNEVNDLGVAEVGLPPSNLDEPSRSKLLGYYGIGEVFQREINAVWGNLIPQTLIDAYLANTEAPGYFDTYGFVAAGVSPGPEYTELDSRLIDLSPYNPKEVGNISIQFK
jgi:hypothetical protein